MNVLRDLSFSYIEKHELSGLFRNLVLISVSNCSIRIREKEKNHERIVHRILRKPYNIPFSTQLRKIPKNAE